jgi:hypothetical protein|tara:strand:- start:3807 stop:4265 length:459 start_codon:yes stop_codon:yes gene_type:complete
MKIKYKGLWFVGLAGVGKTYASNYFIKKIKNSIKVDGDEVRKYISFDLGYGIEDRKKQIQRVLGIGIICIKSKKIPILSTVFMNNETIFKAKKNKIKIIKIERDMNYLKKIRKIYKSGKNVVSKDIYYPNMKVDKVLNEGNSKFILDLKKIL